MARKLESLEGTEGKVYEIGFKFRVFDEDALELAFEDLENAEVFGPGESYKDNTVEENLALVLKHLDVIARFRELESISFIDMGFEEIQ